MSLMPKWWSEARQIELMMRATDFFPYSCEFNMSEDYHLYQNLKYLFELGVLTDEGVEFKPKYRATVATFERLKQLERKK